RVETVDVRYEILEKLGRHKWHVAGEQDERVVVRRGQRCIESAEWAGIENAIFNVPVRSGFIPTWYPPDEGGSQSCLRPHDHYIFGGVRDPRDLPLQNCLAADHERALVTVAEAAGSAADEYRRARHELILPSA